MRVAGTSKAKRNRTAFPEAKRLPPHLLALDKLDVVFLAFLNFALIVEALRLC
jgi:hypothetical protein